MVVGGIIPEADVAPLREAGVAAVYTPKDFDITRIMRDIVAVFVAERSGSRGVTELVNEALDLSAPARRRPERSAPATLNLLESTTPGDRESTRRHCWRELSPAALGGEAPGHVIGVTGPPGAGKSTLLSVLLGAWRRQGKTVAILAVDPSSRRSGGSLLGDRARIEFDPADRGVFIRSTRRRAAGRPGVGHPRGGPGAGRRV